MPAGNLQRRRVYELYDMPGGSFLSRGNDEVRLSGRGNISGRVILPERLHRSSSADGAGRRILRADEQERVHAECCVGWREQ
jgi:hypothetical protein